MKKITLLLIGLILMSTPSYADTRASILLLHNGQGKSFDAEQLQQAVNEAVSGDTICLSMGTFFLENTLIIDKPLCIIGTGNESRIRGSISIAIDNEPKLTSYFLENVRLSKDLTIDKKLDGLKIKKCWIGQYFYTSASTYNIEIDRCYINGLIPTATMESALLTNSIIYNLGARLTGLQVWSSEKNFQFVNCNIGKLPNPNDKVEDFTFTNCIINAVGGCKVSNSTFVNTLSNNDFSDKDLTTVNCYVDKMVCNPTNDDNFPSFTINRQDVTSVSIEKGYLGTDGTVVGAYGGSTPYTLEADGIHIKESVLKVDPVTRQLNVTLKVE